MAFACQRDSYMQEFSSRVVSCEKASIKLQVYGKTQQVEGYEIILEDTVLFPEGGGQPDDHGTINDVQVLRVTRRGTKAVHFTKQPIELGQEVQLKVDWLRRFDHMQQHSGQHLITAIADQMFGYPTTSWNLGTLVSSIELDTPTVKSEEVEEIERVVNEKIRNCTPMVVRVYEEGAPELKQARTRGLPDDYHGPVRIVTIEGLENNMCCGTHVANLAHLQAIKLLYTEKGKKNKTNLFFLAGGRVLRQLGVSEEKDKQLTAMLKGGPDQHVSLIDKLQKTLKVSQKNELNLMRDLAVLEAQKFKSLPQPNNFLSLHRREEIPDFMSIIVNEINDPNVTIFLTVGDDHGSGQMCLSGSSEIVAELGPKVCEVLGGKGAGKGTKFQGKVTNLSQRPVAEKLILDRLLLNGGDR